MKAKQFLYTAIILFPFFSPIKSKAQNRERHRSVTINQTVVDGKVVASDTIITYTDTTTRTINSKEVSREMPYTKGSTVYIDNNYRKLNIRQSKDGKVRLVTTTFFYGAPSFTDEQWLEKLNITMKNTDTGMVITSGGINRSSSTSSTWSNTTTDWNKVIEERNGAVLERVKATEERIKETNERNRELAERTKELAQRSRELAESNKLATQRSSGIPQPPSPPATSSIPGVASINGSGSITINGTTVWGSGNSNTFGPARSFSTSTGSGTAVFDEKGNNVYTSNSVRRELTLYIPAEAKLNVVSKYADVTADHDLKNLHIKISNGSLDMANADNAIINSSYSNISLGNIGTGDITVASGKLSLKNADQLTLNTKYSKIEIDNCNMLSLKSTSDDYDLDAVKSLTGSKNYGNLRIEKLTGSFDLKGTSADTKIRSLEPNVSAIIIDNKYADISLPVSGLENYEVLFSGNYSNVFAPFERRDTTVEKTINESSAFTYTTSNGSVVSKTKAGTAPANQNGTIQRNDDTRIIYTTSDGSTVSSVRAAGTSRSHTNNFVATVGDTKGTHTKFNLTCSSCNVDFK